MPGGALNQGTIRAAAGLGLADAEAEPVVEPAMVSAVPDGALVVGQVAREEELVRRRKAGQRSAVVSATIARCRTLRG